MNNKKVYLKGYVVGHSADTLGHKGLQIQLENMDIVEIDENLVHKGINEPKEVVVPQFVADWIEYCKNTFLSLARALAVSEEDFYNYANQKDHLDLLYFLGSMVNQEKFAKAWLFGYEAEKEKRYLVKMKGVDSRTNYLYYGEGSKTWLFKAKLIDGNFRKSHTRKELEEAGFGDVFNSPLFEVEEVKG